MNYLEIDRCSINNGIGIRCVLFVSGCEHKCLGCQNKSSWDKSSGKPFTEQTMNYIIEYLKNDYVDGLTLSGGDPRALYNREEVFKIAKKVRDIFGDKKSIWVYTGYSWEQLSYLGNIELFDIIVDGVYVQSKRDITLPFRGSSNQRIIDVKKSLKEGAVVSVQFN